MCLKSIHPILKVLSLLKLKQHIHTKVRETVLSMLIWMFEGIRFLNNIE